MSSIVSPCISICKIDPATGLCYGCSRTNEEKKLWKDVNIKDEWKLNNLKKIQTRMSGLQLETFNESYKHKTVYGISLIKKKKLEQK